jgi:membrane protein
MEGGSSGATVRDLLRRFVAEMSTGKLSLMAAAIAFYGIFSLGPVITAFVSLYGLVFDPAAVALQVGALSGIVPKEVLDVVSAELTDIVNTNHSQLSIGLVVSLTIALATANAGTSALMTALNVAFGEEEKRGFVAYHACSLLLTSGLLLFATVSVILLAAVPMIVDMVPVGILARALAVWLRWPLLAALAALAIAAIYRFGPSGDVAHRRWMSWGTAAATALWIVGSALFSVYLSISVHIGKIPAYGQTVGALGAVTVLLMWLWLSAFAVLQGSAIDATIESKMRHDRGIGAKPAGNAQR